MRFYYFCESTYLFCYHKGFMYICNRIKFSVHQMPKISERLITRNREEKPVEAVTIYEIALDETNRNS